MPCGHGLMDFLYQRDGEIIAFARPDLAVAGTGLSSAAPVIDTIPACVPALRSIIFCQPDTSTIEEAPELP